MGDLVRVARLCTVTNSQVATDALAYAIMAGKRSRTLATALLAGRDGGIPNGADAAEALDTVAFLDRLHEIIPPDPLLIRWLCSTPGVTPATALRVSVRLQISSLVRIYAVAGMAQWRSEYEASEHAAQEPFRTISFLLLSSTILEDLTFGDGSNFFSHYWEGGLVSGGKDFATFAAVEIGHLFLVAPIFTCVDAAIGAGNCNSAEWFAAAMLRSVLDDHILDDCVLWAASAVGALHVVQHLPASGADPNDSSPYPYRSAVVSAAAHGHHEVVRCLEQRAR